MDRHQGSDPDHHRRYQGKDRLQPDGALPGVARIRERGEHARCDLRSRGGNVGRGATTTLVGVSHEFIEAYSMNQVE